MAFVHFVRTVVTNRTLTTEADAQLLPGAAERAGLIGNVGISNVNADAALVRGRRTVA